MKNAFVTAVAALLIAGCSPVLNREYMDTGAREFNPSHLIETPEVFKDHLFILGGVIVETKLTEEVSQIEALFVPVDRYGHLRDATRYQGRFIALYPKAKGILDPLIYKKGREITVAGDFLEVRKGRIDQMEYHFPVFEIRQIHLWEDYRNYPYSYWPSPYYSYYPYYPYYSYYPSYPYDPWWRPYPGPYWPPPW